MHLLIMDSETRSKRWKKYKRQYKWNQVIRRIRLLITVCVEQVLHMKKQDRTSKRRLRACINTVFDAVHCSFSAHFVAGVTNL